MSWTRRQMLSSLFRSGALQGEESTTEDSGKVNTERPTLRLQATTFSDGAWKRILDGAATSRFARGKEGLLVRHFFRDRPGGVFVDAGCFLPEEQSGTCYLERHLGWSGLAIDGQDFSQEWQEMRPQSRFVHARLDEMADASTTTLDQVLEEAGVASFDFLSISVDTMDLRVLKGLDLRRYRPQLIKIACGPGQRMPTLEHVQAFGYDMLRDYRPYDKIHRYFAPES